MFRMLNLTYIPWSIDSDNFFIVTFLRLALLLAVFLRKFMCKTNQTWTIDASEVLHLKAKNFLNIE